MKEQIESEARSRAREQIEAYREFKQINSTGEARDEAERMQWFLVWAKLHLGYDEHEGKECFDAERNKMLETLFKRNVQHLTERSERMKEIERQSWNLFKANFIAIDKNGKPLEITGKIEDAIKERFGVPDEKSITAPSEFVAGLVKNLSNHDFKYEDENEDSYFTLKFQRRT
jgi:hypothetical protein